MIDLSGTLDRASHERGDGDRLEALLDARDTWIAPLWRGQLPFRSEGDVPRLGVVGRERAHALIDRAGELVFLGIQGGSAVFAADVSEHDAGLTDVPEAGELGDLRFFGSLLPRADLEVAFAARGILHWHRQARFCGACGGATRPRKGGWQRECQSCKSELFPRTDPAVMALVTHRGRALLARQPAFPAGMYSALAGFAEPGESLEQTLAREVLEEVGLQVGEARYLGSQSWPFPQSLMVAFEAEATSDDVRLDPAELEDSRWVTRDEILAPQGFAIPPAISLAHQILRAWAGSAK